MNENSIIDKNSKYTQFNKILIYVYVIINVIAWVLYLFFDFYIIKLVGNAKEEITYPSVNSLVPITLFIILSLNIKNKKVLLTIGILSIVFSLIFFILPLIDNKLVDLLTALIFFILVFTVIVFAFTCLRFIYYTFLFFYKNRNDCFERYNNSESYTSLSWIIVFILLFCLLPNRRNILGILFVFFIVIFASFFILTLYYRFKLPKDTNLNTV